MQICPFVNLHVGCYPRTIHSTGPGQRGKFPASFFNNNVPVAQTKNYLNARTVVVFSRLKPGEYLIVPSAFNPNETASFILSILSKAETHIHENSNDQDIVEIPKPMPTHNRADMDNKQTLFRQYSDQASSQHVSFEHKTRPCELKTQKRIKSVAFENITTF
ncbi:unnamed protein product [Oncorhynchus mykiss]|uniref:Peptidase C2 calpain domain-containing protein n=1 Tax=Oncorhynchus mykiss TaxID=8022 RepID=A0A060XUU7_ONCMY|nr:unnamed protein product [Oncorhynchus mykiss]